MFFEILIAIIIGCFAGVMTGITPGLHINLVSIIILSFSAYLLDYLSIIPLTVFIISMSITHTFTDFISSIYLGAPSDDTALAVLPGHIMLLEGLGYEAVKLTVIGSLFSLIITILFFPLLIFIVPFIYSNLQNFIGWILLAVVVFMILRESDNNKRFWSFIVFTLSGALGLVVFSIANLKNPLLPLLSGLFGISMLINSIIQKTVLPKQRITDMVDINRKESISSLAAGFFSGSIVSIFPGLGPAQAAIVASQFFKKIGTKSYLVLLGGINTVSMLLALITLYTISKARNGSIIAVQQLIDVLDKNTLMVFAASALVAGGIATILTLSTAKLFSRIINHINYQLLCIFIIVFVSALVIYLSGFIGLYILLISTTIGIVPVFTSTGRNHSMGCLLLPVILYFVF